MIKMTQRVQEELRRETGIYPEIFFLSDISGVGCQTAADITLI